MLHYERAGDALTLELRRRVDEYFRSSGRSPKADRLFWSKLALFVATTVALWAALAIGLVPRPWALLACALLGLSMAAVGFNVAHDAVHGAISARGWVNRAWGRVLDVFGANSANWALAHNFAHHTFTNVAGVDVDLSPGRTLVFHPHQRPARLHRYQHLYAPLLYSLAFVAWVVAKDLRQALMRDPRTGARQPLRRVPEVLAWKAVHLGVYLGVPLACAGYTVREVLAGYLVCLLFVGLPIALVFQLPHLTEGTIFPHADEAGVLPGTFAAHQLRTTANFADGSWWWTFITGGQNHQIEHHLLPHVCHTHYPALSPLVRELAHAHGLSYRVEPSFPAALAAHFRLLRRLGRSEVPTGEGPG